MDKSKGVMWSIKALFKKEGLEDTTKYVLKCARMGAPWIQWDDMWERYTVMVMQRSHSEIFVKAWRLKQQRSEETSPDSSTAASSAVGNPGNFGKATAKGKAAAKTGMPTTGTKETTPWHTSVHDAQNSAQSLA